MKIRTSIFLVLIFTIPVFSQSGWQQQPSGVNTFLWGISFADANTGYIASDGGKVLKTTNKGNSWNVQNLTPAVNVSAIDFADALTGYTAGSQGKFFKTTNGGANWINLNSPSASFIQAICFIDINTGFLGTTPAANGELYKTTNGGTNWIQYGAGVFTSNIMDIFFTGTNTGYISMYDGKIAKTTSAGANWQLQSTGLLASEPIFGIYFIDSLNGFAGSSSGKIIKTTNGGSNWSTVFNSPGNPVTDVYFTSVSDGYAIGGGAQQSMVVMKTFNGGANWDIETLSVTGHANNICFTSALEGYISCENGIIYKTTNGGNPIGISPINSNVPGGFRLQQNYPNPFNPVTNIKFNIPVQSMVHIDIFDITGRLIETLVNAELSRGYYEINWNASKVSSGIYYYIINAGNFHETKKMVLIK